MKRFIFDVVPLFHDVTFKPKGGAPPVLQLMTGDDKIIEEIPLDKYSTQDCTDLLEQLGFYKKSSKDEEISEEIKANLSYKTKAQLESETAEAEQREEL